LQRFVSEDPIGFAGGDLNLYRYVGSNPINATDPSRYCAVDTILQAGFMAHDPDTLATSKRRRTGELSAVGNEYCWRVRSLRRRIQPNGGRSPRLESRTAEGGQSR
jgi:hypothetical protein